MRCLNMVTPNAQLTLLNEDEIILMSVPQNMPPSMLFQDNYITDWRQASPYLSPNDLIQFSAPNSKSMPFPFSNTYNQDYGATFPSYNRMYPSQSGNTYGVNSGYMASPATRLPLALWQLIFVYCDLYSLQDIALVCRRWLQPARRALLESWSIDTIDAARYLQSIPIGPYSSLKLEYIKRVDVTFALEEPRMTSPGAHRSRQSPTLIGANRIHEILYGLSGIESLRADWIGAVSSSRSASSPLVASAQPVPSFLTIPHVSRNLRHLELRGGSWPFESLLPTLGFMPSLVKLSFENIYESAPTVFLPSHIPAFRLEELSLARCTLSGESLAWLLASSQKSLRHLTVNSVRRRADGGSFNTALSIVGPSLHSLRIRNYAEISVWDEESIINAGLGFCQNLRTLVVWCEVPATSSSAFGGFSRGNVGTHSSSYSPNRQNQEIQPEGMLHLYPGVSTDTMRGHYSQPSPSHSRSSLNPNSSPILSYSGRALSTYSMPYSSSGPGTPQSSPSMSPGQSFTSLSGSPPMGAPGFVLPSLVMILRRGWLPQLKRLVVPARQIEQCPSRMECQAELLARGVSLESEWSS